MPHLQNQEYDFMKKFLTAFAVSSVILASFATAAFAHGGGCRRSSPPGQCCHADNSNGGRVHCH